MANRKRNIEVRFRVTQEELEMIHKKMAQYGTTNLSAFLRKMSIDGYVVKLELPELKEMVSLLRYSSNNLNQLTKRVHETGRIYDADLEDLRQSHERLWDAARDILSALAKLNCPAASLRELRRYRIMTVQRKGGCAHEIDLQNPYRPCHAGNRPVYADLHRHYLLLCSASPAGQWIDRHPRHSGSGDVFPKERLDPSDHCVPVQSHGTAHDCGLDSERASRYVGNVEKHLNSSSGVNMAPEPFLYTLI